MHLTALETDLVDVVLHLKAKCHLALPSMRYIKLHGSVLCGPRKQIVRKLHEYIDRKNEATIFTHL